LLLPPWPFDDQPPLELQPPFDDQPFDDEPLEEPP
jgi:hypothetical protein